MKDSINERIRSIYELSGEKSVRAYALKRNLAPTTFGECLKGSEPRFSLLKALLDGEPFISAEWLMRGKGEMILQEEKENLAPSATSEDDIRLMREKIISLEAENKVLREIAGLHQGERSHEGKIA